MNLRCKKIIFSTNLLKKFLNRKILKKSELNFVLLDFKIYKNNSKKKFDLIIYFRRHENKFFSHHSKLVKKFIANGKKVVVIGDKLKIKGVYNYGKVRRIFLNNLIKRSKYSLSGDDNLLSLFNLECLKLGIKVIYNKKLSFQKPSFIKKNFISHNFDE